jgi:homoserine dehydrogenase
MLALVDCCWFGNYLAHEMTRVAHMENVAELAEQIARSILQYDPDAAPADTNSPLFRDLVEMARQTLLETEAYAFAR